MFSVTLKEAEQLVRNFINFRKELDAFGERLVSTFDEDVEYTGCDYSNKDYIVFHYCLDESLSCCPEYISYIRKVTMIDLFGNIDDLILKIKEKLAEKRRIAEETALLKEQQMEEQVRQTELSTLERLKNKYESK